MLYPDIPPLYNIEVFDKKENRSDRKTRKLPIVIKR